MTNPFYRRWLLFVQFCLLVAGSAVAAGSSANASPSDAAANSNSVAVAAIRKAQPLVHAHAHNDYEHARPLLDALEQGCALLIDVKSDGNATYSALRGVLATYSDLLTEFTSTNVTTRAVTVILSGNRAAELVATEPIRHVALDGRLSDLESNPPVTLYPWVSDDWRKHFTWRGEGRIPEVEQERLHQLVRQAHQQGRRLRFWATPDSAAGWRVLQESSVDVIGTDNLSGLGTFLRAAGK